ncbi:PsiF family protein [Pseudomonas sp. LA21]|uniref:PsiF family protein n=1 Tax=unclassified Pseudomonas TaxID=196821 RepID=UPI001FB64DDA|nr:PsiF family protein [Pseudomonas sp. LA21]MCJ1885036.1 PsiF family protein [Pseudomonas sp. LA21]
MTTVRIPLLALALLFSVQGFAATAAQTAQQEKMKTCNADATAKALKGDERKAFMSKCLSAGGDVKATTAQQEKMKTCNADATKKALKGDERKAFMSTCLKK